MHDAQPRIPVLRTAVAAYGRGIGALFGGGALFRYFVYALLLGLAAFGVRIYLVFVYPWYRWSLPKHGVDIAVGAATFLIYAALMGAVAPFGVAVYRKLLLGEAPQEFYLVAMGGRRQRRFFLASIVVLAAVILATAAIPAAVYLLYGVNPLDAVNLTRAATARPLISWTIVATELFAYAVVALAAARSTFAFPAIAIDRPGASLLQSFAETRGATWRLFFVFVVIYLPPLTIYTIASNIILSIALRQGSGSAVPTNRAIAALYTSPPVVALYALMVVLLILIVAVTAAAAARCYEIKVGHRAQQLVDVFL